MQRSTPFARVNSFMSLISAALAGGLNMTAALAQVGAYESRGHGRGKYSGRGRGNACTPWKEKLKGQTNGQREIARRSGQIASGMLKVGA